MTEYEFARFRDEADVAGTSVAVGTTSTPVVSRNGDRFEIVIANDSDTVIYLRLADSGAVLNSGLRLNPKGGCYSSTVYNGAVCAIHGNLDNDGGATAGATKTLTVVEV